MVKKGENITKRKDGRWEARVNIGRRIDGNIRYKFLYASSYNEVRRKKEAYIRTQGELGTKTEARIKFGEVVQKYLDYVRPGLKESSYSRYERIAAQHICPQLGHYRITELTPQIIETFLREKQLHGNLKTHAELSAKRVQDISSVMKQIFQYAYSIHLLNFKMTILPRKIHKKTIEVLTENEIDQLVFHVLQQESVTQFGILISLTTGIRIGELCALTWGDIDLNARVIHISKTLQRIPICAREHTFPSAEKTRIVIGSPKTSAGVRQIPIPSFLTPYLQKYAQGQTCYVLSGTDKYIEPSNYYLKYQKWLQKWQIRKHPFHALRHTFATKCMENGFDPKTLAEILGHSNVSVTLKRYVHPNLEWKRKNMERITQLISSQMESHRGLPIK